MGPRAAEALYDLSPHVAGYDSAKKADQWARAPRRQYPAGWAEQYPNSAESYPAICGYYSTKKSRPMGPRAAEALYDLSLIHVWYFSNPAFLIFEIPAHFQFLS